MPNTDTVQTSAHPAQQGTTSAAADTAAPTLTIDRQGEYSLRNLWLRIERDEAAATQRINKMYLRACRKKDQSDFKALSHAYSALLDVHRTTVKRILERGGLLHVGCVQ